MKTNPNLVKKTYFIETYGCTYNQSDSEKIETILSNQNFIKTSLEDANYIIINTCAVKQTTETKLMARIYEVSQNFQKKFIIVTGCLPQIDKKIYFKIQNMLLGHGIIVNPNQILSIDKFIDYYLNNKCEQIQNLQIILDKAKINPRISKSQISGIVQISEGCIYNCTYCCTKFARGKLFSFDNSLIIKQIEYYIQNGIQEIYLTSQDLGIYNFNGIRLHHLLNQISQLKGDFKVRLGMLNPNYLMGYYSEFIKIFNDTRFFRFLHIPIQSASNRILALMKRPYKIDMVDEIIRKIIQFDKNFSFSTDIICGFPTESDEEHKETLNFLMKWRPEIVNISKYTNRPNIEAKKLPQLKSQLIKERSKQATDIYAEYSIQDNNKWIGWEGEILINEFNPDEKYPYSGRNIYYKTIICESGQLGEKMKIKIVAVSNYSLIGQRV